MNFYDKVHEMIRSLKETAEYREYIKLKTEIKENDELKNKITEFKETQRQEQMKYIKGEGMTEEAKVKLSQMYSEIIQNDLGVKFFQAEIKLDVMLADMQKIISEGIQDVVEL